MSKVTKIVARIVGGLGNQLFCYAAARRMALVNGAELVIDDVSGFSHDRTYRRHYQLDQFKIPCRKATPAERLEPFARLRRYLKRRLSSNVPFENRSCIQQEGIDFDPRVLQIVPRHTVYMEGLWQSEEYFKDVEKTIRSDLRILPPTDDFNLGMAENIKKSKAVALHVRFFDKPGNPGNYNVPSDYYNRAIAQVETLVPDAHYFIFSDQPDAARKLISLPEARITLVSHNTGDQNAYADLWLMTQCQHFIITNSTFSWWGAWLADKASQIVITPDVKSVTGVCGWGFEGLIPARWLII